MSTVTKKTIIIKPGESGVYPAGARITTFLVNGEAVPESSCDLPTETPRKCYYFKWEYEGGDYFLGMVINGVEYLFSDWPGPLGLATYSAVAYMINNHPEMSAIAEAFCGDDASSDKAEVYIAAPDSVSPPELILFDEMSTGGFKYYIKGVASTACPECETYIA